MNLAQLSANSTSVTSQSSPDDNTLVGWTAQGSGRGTWDIITSCFFTILICIWTVIHPRVHVPRRLRNAHKMCQMIKALLAPEMVCLESMQEWVQARKLARRCAKPTDGGLRMVHAYYLTMMGIRYCYGPAGYRTLWPGQFAWLLNSGLVRWADRAAWGLADDVIEDKSKADGLVKLAAVCQVTWFGLQCIVRAAHHLPLAPLEVMTIAYVVNAALTYFFWWQKPKDIATPTFVRLPEMTPEQWAVFESLSMENTYDMVHPGETYSLSIAWYLVARDCEDDDVLIKPQQNAQVCASSVQDQAHPTTEHVTNKSVDVSGTRVNEIELGIHRAPPVHALQPAKIQEDSDVITEWDAALYMTRFWPLVCLMGALFGAMHMIAWNSTFPTEVELWLWRASAITSVATAILTMQFRKIILHWDGPLTMVQLGSPVLYVISRLIMSGETFAALRAMSAATYQTFEIWNYWFHFL